MFDGSAVDMFVVDMLFSTILSDTFRSATVAAQSVDFNGSDALVVPLINAVGFGMPVPNGAGGAALVGAAAAAALTTIAFGACNCDKLFRLSDLVSSFFPAAKGALSFASTFGCCSFGATILDVSSAQRPGLLSFRSLFDLVANNVDDDDSLAAVDLFVAVRSFDFDDLALEAAAVTSGSGRLVVTITGESSFV